VSLADKDFLLEMHQPRWTSSWVWVGFVVSFFTLQGALGIALVWGWWWLALPVWAAAAVVSRSMNSAVGMVGVGIIVGLGYEFGASHELAKDLRWLEITIGITLALLLVVLPLLLKRFLEKRQPA